MAHDSYRVLARKWRPQTFDDVIGQEHISRTLRNAIRSGRIGHAFLFIGTRGVGKTTSARILAKALNCASSPTPTPDPCGVCDTCRSIAAGTNIDVVEIDGASNNGVDNIREIRDNIRMVPSSSRYKIYIIDEVHQLSSGAFNALLKTLEEPPEHGIFILATTETHKVPATIISRCQRYDFRRVGLHGISELLRKIIEAEGIKCTEEALQAIARAADGSVRDGESILEQVISYCDDEITFQDVFDVLGLVDWRVMHSLSDALLAQDVAAQLRLIEEVVANGKDLSQFVQDILRYFRNLLVCKTTDPKDLLALPDDEIAEMQERAKLFSLTQLIRLVEQFAELTKDFDSQLAQRIALESLLIRLSKVSVEMSLDAVLEKLALLGAGGLSQASYTPPSNPPPANPKQAAPPRPQPQAAAAIQPETLSEPLRAAPDRSLEDIASEWGDLTQRIGSHSLALGLAIGSASPSVIEGHTLVLLFPAHQGRNAAIAERPEHHEAILAVLSAFAGNVSAFRVELAKETGKKPASVEEEALVSPKEAQRVEHDPHVALVLDVFKGHIVDIKQPLDRNTAPPSAPLE